MKKIAIVGLGLVGKTICSLLLQKTKISYQIFVVDISPSICGAFMDLEHAATLSNHQLLLGTRNQLEKCDCIFYCCGTPVGENGDRLATHTLNKKIANSVFHGLNIKSELILVISNPNDLIAQHINDNFVSPETYVLGTGTLLDTARIKTYTNYSNQKEQLFVLGEHGDSMVICGSYFDNLASSLQKSYYKTLLTTASIIKETQQGTTYGVSKCALHLVDCFYDDVNHTTIGSFVIGEKNSKTLHVPSSTYTGMPILIGRRNISSNKLTGLSINQLQRLKKSVSILNNKLKN